VLERIKLNALGLFDKYKPSTLVKDDVGFFDEQMDFISNASLPPADTEPEKERQDMLKVADEMEHEQEK